MKRYLCIFLSCISCVFSFEDAKGLIQWMVNGNYQKKPSLEIAELFHVDEMFFQELSEEVLHLISHYTPSYATDASHLSYWTKPEGLITQFSLLNSSGKLDDYADDHNRSIRNKRFFYAKKYPRLAEFIALFPHAVNFRINILNEKSCFTQHQEDICFLHTHSQKPALRARFYLPIRANPDAHMFMQGHLYHFQPSVIYYFNNGSIHDGINTSPTLSRVHLVWDMLLTEDTYERMFARSIPMPQLEKTESIELEPVGEMAIDPNFKKWPRKFSYGQARFITLCPVQ